MVAVDALSSRCCFDSSKASGMAGKKLAPVISQGYLLEAQFSLYQYHSDRLNRSRNSIVVAK